jgi:hypothetical protein
MADARMPYASLYYPYATFGDERWLKKSLLSWNRVALIRPAGVEASMSEVGPVEETINRMMPEFVVPLTPSDYDLEPVAEALETDRLDGLRERYGREARDALTVPMRPGRQCAPADADPRLLWIYTSEYESKMSWMLADNLRYFDLAEEMRGHHGEQWLGFHPAFGAVYLTALAGVLAERRGLTAVTDDVAVHRVAGALSLARIDDELRGAPRSPALANSTNEAEELYLHVALNASVHPVDLDMVPVEKLIEFRGTHEKEILAFRGHLESLAPRLTGLAKVWDQESLQRHLNDIYREETKGIVEELRKAMKRSAIETVVRALTTKFEVSAAMSTAPGAAAMGIGAYIGVSAGAAAAPVAVALSAIPIIRTYRFERARQADSPVAFLLAAERELGPAQILQESLPKELASD